MDALLNLVVACQADETLLRQQAQSRMESWQRWLTPISEINPTGEDPGYDDDFQRIREEVNKLSGIDTGLICQLAEKVLTTEAKDVRVATYYCWARLHQDGETGFEEQLRLLSILPAGQPLSAAQLNQAEQHLQQLIASYALLKHQKE